MVGAITIMRTSKPFQFTVTSSGLFAHSNQRVFTESGFVSAQIAYSITCGTIEASTVTFFISMMQTFPSLSNPTISGIPVLLPPRIWRLRRKMSCSNSGVSKTTFSNSSSELNGVGRRLLGLPDGPFHTSVSMLRILAHVQAQRESLRSEERRVGK